MSENPKKSERSDRQIIEARRARFLRRLKREDDERTHEWIASSGVCLSLIYRSGEDILRQGEWTPDAESQALASDPRSPVDLLVHLARHWPGEVLANPSLDLGLLERPDTLQQASPETLLALVRHPGVSSPLLASILAIWSDSPALRMAVVDSSATPEEVLKMLAEDPDEAVRMAALVRLGRG